MIKQEQIDRINELARKSKTPEGLTPEEKEEQQTLRQAYVAAVRASLRGQLDHTVLLRPDGTKQRVADLRRKDKRS